MTLFLPYPRSRRLYMCLAVVDRWLLRVLKWESYPFAPSTPITQVPVFMFKQLIKSRTVAPGLLVLVVGMTVLFIQHDLQTYEIVAAAILLLLTIVLVSVLLLGVWRPKMIEGLLKCSPTRK